MIHAATMVVAGVFQIARMFPMWIEYAPQAMSIVVWIGVFTAFYAAAVACAQSDIKRVLAFSTISQIAFMMVALGVCLPGHHGAVLDNHAQLGYMASMFHLFTHAMFKACLFLQIYADYPHHVLDFMSSNCWYSSVLRFLLKR